MNTDDFVKKTTFEEIDVGIFWIFVNNLYTRLFFDDTTVFYKTTG